MKEGPEELAPQSGAKEKKTKTVVRELVLVSAGCAIVAFVLGAATMNHYELGLPFAASGLAAGIFAMKKAGWKRVESGPAFLAANAVLLVIGMLSLYGQNFTDMSLAGRNNCSLHMAMLGRCFSEYAAMGSIRHPINGATVFSRSGGRSRRYLPAKARRKRGARLDVIMR